jgi:hypothetical protein
LPDAEWRTGRNNDSGTGTKLETPNIVKTRTINELDMLKRVSRFILEHPITPPIPRVTTLSGEVNTSIAAIEAAAGDQTGGSGVASGGTASKREKALELRTFLKELGRTSRALDRETHPGVAEQFRLPDSESYAALAAAARAAIAAATPLESVFIEHAMPATFLADLAALLTQFESAASQKVDGLLTQIGGTSGLNVRSEQGVEAAQKLDAIIRNHFRNDPVTLDVWRHARHIERAAIRAEDVPALSGTGGTTQPAS